MSLRTVHRSSPFGAPRLLAAAPLLFAVPLFAEAPDVRARLIAPASASAGGRATLVVEMTLGPNWHVNGHVPAEKFLIPTVVKLTPTAGTAGEVRYPEPVEKRFPFSDKPMLVYEGTVRFESDLSIPSDASGKVAVAGSVAFQACNDRQCFPPAKIPLESSISITAAAPGR